MPQDRAERVDLNLFRTFNVIMSNRSLAAAGRELGLTGSAISHALARLRVLFDDDLFLAGSGGMSPTPRAQQVASGIREALDMLDASIGPAQFDPGRSRRVFHLGASDYAGLLILPGLLRRLGEGGATVRLRVVPNGRLDIVQLLDEGRLDAAVGWFGRMPERIRSRIVYREAEALVVRAGHPLTEGKVTVPRLLSFPHLAVELTGTETAEAGGFYDDRGLLRRIWQEHLLVDSHLVTRGMQYMAVTVPGFASVVPVVTASDLVATLPLRLARRAAAQDGAVAILPLPYEPLQVTGHVVWHQRADADTGLRWLMDELAAAAAMLEAVGGGGDPS